MKSNMQQAKAMDTIIEILWARAYSYIFEISLDLELFEKLKGHSYSLEQIAQLCNFPVSSTRIMLQYLCSLDLLQFNDNMFSNSQLADQFLANHELIRDLKGWVPDKMEDFKNRLTDPPPQPWYQIRDQQKEIRSADGVSNNFFVSNMRHQWRISKGEELSVLYDFSKHKKLLDIGGASGGWCLGILKNNPHLFCTIFDLPEVCRLINNKENFDSFPDTISFQEGNIFRDELETDADVVLIANVLHDWTREDGRLILQKIYNALQPGGVVLVYEYYLNDNWAGPLASVFHGVTVLGPDNESGWQPSYSEMKELLRESGFNSIEQSANVVIGKK
jgi:SAM-dependent methyltransferase